MSSSLSCVYRGMLIISIVPGTVYTHSFTIQDEPSVVILRGVNAITIIDEDENDLFMMQVFVYAFVYTYLYIYTHVLCTCHIYMYMHVCMYIYMHIMNTRTSNESVICLLTKGLY